MDGKTGFIPFLNALRFLMPSENDRLVASGLQERLVEYFKLQRYDGNQAGEMSKHIANEMNSSASI